VGTVGEPDCGDYIRIFIVVKDDRLIRVNFEACGCPASIATTSVLTEIAMGKTINEALAITESEILEALGGLPEEKVHCSNLGNAALKQAILYYLQNRNSFEFRYKKAY
jgi:nitrogen fixation protein NifU and related proteins